MAAINDGGPAFPCVVDSTQPLGRQVGNTAWEVYGLTMRDYFAAQAMSSIAREPGESCHGYIEQRAKVAYMIADAMIRARAAGLPVEGQS